MSVELHTRRVLPSEMRLRQALGLDMAAALPEHLSRNKTLLKNPKEIYWTSWCLENALGELGLLIAKLAHCVSEAEWSKTSSCDVSAARRNLVDFLRGSGCDDVPLARAAARSFLHHVTILVIGERSESGSHVNDLVDRLEGVFDDEGVDAHQNAFGAEEWLSGIRDDAMYVREYLLRLWHEDLPRVLRENRIDQLPHDMQWALERAGAWAEQTLDEAFVAPSDYYELHRLDGWRMNTLIALASVEQADMLVDVQPAIDQTRKRLDGMGLGTGGVPVLVMPGDLASKLLSNSPSSHASGVVIEDICAWLSSGTAINVALHARERQLERVLAHELVHTTQSNAERFYDERANYSVPQRLMEIGLMEGVTEMLAHRVIGDTGDDWRSKSEGWISYRHCVKIVSALAARACPDDLVAQLAWTIELSRQPMGTMTSWVCDSIGEPDDHMLCLSYESALICDLEYGYASWLRDTL